MLIDAFTFYNELDLLDIRLNELNDIVDKFIIVEANKTQSLIDKPFNFENNKARYEKFLDKIVYIKVENCPSNEKNLWTMENFQRNCVMRGLEKIGITKNDLIMISDMDEIPRASAVSQSLSDKNFSNFMAYTLDINFYAYFMNLKSNSITWPGAVIFKPDLLTRFSIQNIKDAKGTYPKCPNGGWHFSWLGGYQSIRNKALSCIEPYDKSKIPSEEDFKKYFDEYLNSPSKGFIHIENLNMKGIDLFINNDFSDYPKYLLENFDKYKHHFLI